jgi:uncharacterized protein YceK
MSFRSLASFFLAGLAVSAALLTGGCAATVSASRPAKEIVGERAQARWDALVRRDWSAAYGYLTPAYRAVVSAERYGNQFAGPMQWQSAKVQGVECEQTRCIATVEISFRLLLPGHLDRVSATFVEETWLLEDGQWYKFEKL